MQLNTKPTKKMMLPLILEVLREHSSSEHTLSQKDIREILESQYMMSADRKSVRRNIDCLIEMGYPIEYTITTRRRTNSETGEPEEEEMISELWLEKDFEDSELRLLIDSILFSSHIPEKQKNDLIDKLINLSGKHFKSKMRHVKSLSNQQPQNPQLFLNIDILDEAIKDGKQVRFSRLEYDDAGKLQIRKVHGEVVELEVNPYQLVAKKGHYYLICQRIGAATFASLRIDLLTNVRVLDKPLEPYKDPKTGKSSIFKLEEYLKEHPLNSEEYFPIVLRDRIVRDVEAVVLKVRKRSISDVIDFFGTNVTISSKAGVFKEVRVKADIKDIIDFALVHFPDVRIHRPTKLSQLLANRALRMLFDYWKLDGVLPNRFVYDEIDDEIKGSLENLLNEMQKFYKAQRAKTQKKKQNDQDEDKS